MLIIYPNCDGSLNYQNMGGLNFYTDEKKVEKTKITQYAVCRDCSKIYEVWKKQKEFKEITQQEWNKIKNDD